MKLALKKSKAEVPSVAMGDIAFNLLIFFVILARSQDDSHLKWTPAKVPKIEKAGYAPVRITIDVNNKKYLNGVEIGNSQLSGAISKGLEGLPAGKRLVLLKAHKDTTALTFEPVIEAISEAGGEMIHVLDTEKKP